MGKGESTKERIIERTAPLFNQMGFFGASMADVMRATGLKKGGIYNHFESKEDLALQAFDHAVGCFSARVTARLEVQASAKDRILAFADVLRENYTDPPVAGGCPILNTAVESDDAHPTLRERAQAAMDRCRSRLHEVVTEGIAAGELRPELDADVFATRFIAVMEGGVMMSRLYGDPIHIDRAVEFVEDILRRELVA